VNFWKQQPALLYGLYILLGAALSLAFSWVFFLPLLFLFYSVKKQAVLGCAAAALSALWAHLFYELPQVPETGVPIEGIFQVRSVSESASPFARSYLYKGVCNGIPCRFYVPLKKQRPLADSDLQIRATLVQKNGHDYTLKKVSWEKTKGPFRFAELRFRAKEKVRRHIEGAIQDRQAAAFLSSMITGEVDDRTLSLQFQKLGLQHILGVSGFQFVLLAGCSGALLRFLMPYKGAAACLLGFMTLYFLFLGDSPPVQRAWIAISLYLLGILLDLPASPLNALGAALGWEVLSDPLTIFQIGFQLSFLCTFAILFLYPIVRRPFTKLFPVRSFQEARRMPLLDQHGYAACSLLRESLALNAAVHILSIPVLLALFHRFPLLSVPYNLFFPFGATLSYFLCLLGFLIPWIHPVNALFTSFLLKIASDPPLIADFSLRTDLCGMEAAVVVLTLLFAWGIYRNTERYPSGTGSVG